MSGGTHSYLPPEHGQPQYLADQHDSFSLGVTLMAIATGGTNRLRGGLTLESSEQSDGTTRAFNLPVVPLSGAHPRFLGIGNSRGLEVYSYHDIVIRLLDKNPVERMTVREAVTAFEHVNTP